MYFFFIIQFKMTKAIHRMYFENKLLDYLKNTTHAKPEKVWAKCILYLYNDLCFSKKKTLAHNFSIKLCSKGHGFYVRIKKVQKYSSSFQERSIVWIKDKFIGFSTLGGHSSAELKFRFLWLAFPYSWSLSVQISIFG